MSFDQDRYKLNNEEEERSRERNRIPPNGQSVSLGDLPGSREPKIVSGYPPRPP